MPARARPRSAGAGPPRSARAAGPTLRSPRGPARVHARNLDTAGQLIDWNDRAPDTFTMVDLRALDIRVAVGDELAIVLGTPADTDVGTWVSRGFSDSYTGGRAWGYTDAGGAWLSEGIVDVGFQTWVGPVPEPTTAALLGLGLAVLARRRRAAR